MAVTWDKLENILKQEGIQPEVREALEELKTELEAVEARVTTLEP